MFAIQKKITLALLIILVISLFVLTCQMEHGLEPIRSGISGTIKYLGKWPQNTAEVRIVGSTKFPPSDLNDLIIGDILPIGGDSTIYTFYLDPGDYYVGLVWRERDAAWGIQSIFGIYIESDTVLTPSLITIPDDTTIVTGKDIIADFAYARRASKSSISGTITFIGEWPENVENFMVIATSDKQLSPKSLFELAFSGLYPAYVDTIDYSVYAAPGTYHAVIVIIKWVDQPWALKDIRGLLVKEIIVPTEDSKIDSVDFPVYF